MAPIPRLSSRLLHAALALVLSTTPVLADETRHCDIEVRFEPQNASQTWRSFGFSVHKTVSSILQVNQARRAARGAAIRCIAEHWEAGLTGVKPDRCDDHGAVDFRGYPFHNIRHDATRALCEANRDFSGTMYIRVLLYISGSDGCYFGGTHDPVVIAQNQRIYCLRRSDPAPMDDEPATPPTEEDEPYEPIGEGGGWDCVGEGCGGTPADEALPDAPAPAAASYQLLPSIRLPGNDLYLIELDAPNWLLCRQACTDDPRCGAWTYRGSTMHAGPVCLIKSRAGLPIPDPCCRSGIKR